VGQEAQDRIGGGAVVVRTAIRPISESQDMIGGGAVVVRAAIWPISDGPDGTEAGACRAASNSSTARSFIVNRFNLSLSSANSFSSSSDTPKHSMGRPVSSAAAIAFMNNSSFRVHILVCTGS